jgi:glycopeptide antibiotics resistance protein
VIVSRRLARIATVLSIALIVTVTVPWTSMVWHSHWARVRWVPFTDIVRPGDVILNILLYVPLGASVAAGRQRWWTRLLTAGIVAAILSASIEALQAYSHMRFPSPTDFVNNVAGGLAGAAAASWLVPELPRRP